MGGISVKARGQETGEGREGFQIMIQVSHLGKEDGAGRRVEKENLRLDAV